MKLVTKNIHYAIKSLLYFTLNSSRVISVNELVKKLNMRRAFLRRILQALSKQKILKSLKGNSGGFILRINPDKIRILDIVRIFHNEIDIINCLLDKQICPQPDTCLLMHKVKNIEFQLNNALKQLTITKLLKSMGKQAKKIGST